MSDELLRLSKELRGEYADASRAVADFIVLNLGNVDEDLSSGIVKLDGLENGRAIVGDIDLSR